MQRDKKLEIRLTQEMFEDVERRSKMLNMTKSEYARRSLSGGGCNIDTKGMTQRIYEMQSLLNMMGQIGPTMDDVEKLNEEVYELWQFLR